jgi:hypothetical protein
MARIAPITANVASVQPYAFRQPARLPGADLETVTLSGSTHIELADGRVSLDQLVDMAADGADWPLVDGRGNGSATSSSPRSTNGTATSCPTASPVRSISGSTCSKRRMPPRDAHGRLRITLDDEDLSPTIRPRLISLRITKKRGGNGVAIGLVDKGRFKVDEVEHSGPPDSVSIRASAADFASGLTTRRGQSRHDTTLGAILQTVAGRHKPQSAALPPLAWIAAEAASKERESDIALLRRLGREHDAVPTIKAGRLIFAPIGAGITAMGKALPGVTVRRRDGDRRSYRVAKREARSRRQGCG